MIVVQSEPCWRNICICKVKVISRNLSELKLHQFMYYLCSLRCVDILLDAQELYIYWLQSVGFKCRSPPISLSQFSINHIPHRFAKLVNGYACAYQESRGCVCVCVHVCMCVCVCVCFMTFFNFNFLLCMIIILKVLMYIILWYNHVMDMRNLALFYK